MLIYHELRSIHIHFWHAKILIGHELPTIRVRALLLIEYVLDLERYLILFVISPGVPCAVL